MGVTVGANAMSVVHAGSSGTTIAFPDACKTPTPPGPPMPIPYPNVAKSSDADKCASKVKADGNPLCVKDSVFSTSTGDEAGSVGGLISSKTKGKAEFVNFSFDVKAEGKNVPRAMDMMLHNDKNTPPVPLLQGPVIMIPGSNPDENKCLICNKNM